MLKHAIPNNREAPDPFYNAVAVAIEGTIFIFGGRSFGMDWNELWILSRMKIQDLSHGALSNTSVKRNPHLPDVQMDGNMLEKLWVFWW